MNCSCKHKILDLLVVSKTGHVVHETCSKALQESCNPKSPAYRSFPFQASNPNTQDSRQSPLADKDKPEAKHESWKQLPQNISALCAQVPTQLALGAGDDQGQTFNGGHGILCMWIVNLVARSVALSPLNQRIMDKCLHYTYQSLSVVSEDLRWAQLIISI